MKFHVLLIIILAAVLSACNFTLAEDVTPPPGYIPPTPVPTLVLIPQQTPNTAIGEAIYFEKCAPCHGDTGLGDGAQGIQLGVTVPAFALPEIARPASPAGWYTTVTRGRIDRFMPPFVSLNDQQRWDVVAYIMTLHTSEDEIQKGKKIFETNCQNCSLDFYKDQSKMSGLSTVELARIIRLGNDEIQAFGENLSDDDMWAVAEYLRSLSYDTTPPSNLVSVSSTETLSPSTTETPSDEITPGGTEQPEITNETAPGTVSGVIDNKTGTDLPANMKVTLRGYEHDLQNPNAGLQEIMTVDGVSENDGTFIFENVEMPEGRIFLAEVPYEGIEYSSDFAIVKSGETSIILPPVVLYGVTTDTSGLVVDELDIFLTATSDGTFEVLTLYSFRNIGELTIHVEMGDSQEIPFLKFPAGAQGMGYEALQDSAPFTITSGGFALIPNQTPYGILAFSSVANADEIEISQSLVLPASVVRVFVPDGMEAQSNQITQSGSQDVQGEIYQSYLANDLQAGDVLNLTISGTPNTAATPVSESGPNRSLLIGAAGLGIALILAGAWMYFRDRTIREDEEDDESEFDTAEDVMDAIIALDDLHRVKKISEEAYQNRRTELKEILKEMM